jgi:hypothetical protein
MRQPQGDNQRHGADRIDDGEHADAPPPGRRTEHRRRDVSADPGVDDEGRGGDVGEEEARARARDVADDDLDD